MLTDAITKLKTVFFRAAKVMGETLRPRPCSIVSGLVTDLLRSRAELAVENVLLRQQLIVAGRKIQRPAFRRHERTLVTLLAAALPRCRDALLLVKPETVLRWHRGAFRLLWRWKSWPKKAPAPRLSSDVIELIQRMATENRLWGAERVRGELIKLGIHVAKRTVQRHLLDRRNPAPPRGQSWHTFLRNHTVWACDFLQVYDVWFRPIFAFDRAAKGAGIHVLRAAVQAPLMNSVCERFLGSVRRDCLDHIVILGERHIEHTLRDYCFNYFNVPRPRRGIVPRPRRGIGQRLPTPRALQGRTDRGGVIAIPVLGGLHHDYRAAA